MRKRREERHHEHEARFCAEPRRRLAESDARCFSVSSCFGTNEPKNEVEDWHGSRTKLDICVVGTHRHEGQFAELVIAVIFAASFRRCWSVVEGQLPMTGHWQQCCVCG